MPSNDLIRESQDPYTGATRLAELAQIDRALWPAIAVHPAAYPALLDWLGQQGDPTVNSVLALRSGSSTSALPPSGPPPPPAETTTAPVGPAIAAAQPRYTQDASPVPAPLGAAASDNNQNLWRLGGVIAIVLILIGGLAFGATKVFDADGDVKEEATPALTVEPHELAKAPTVGAPSTGAAGDSDSTNAVFCDRFMDARDALVGDDSGTASAETAKRTAVIFRDIEGISPAEIKGDIGIMASYFETMSDPGNLETSKLSERIDEFTAAGENISAWYSSNCM